MNNTTRFSILLRDKSGCKLNFTQTRNSLTNKYRHGPMKHMNPDTPWKQFFLETIKGDAYKFLKDESKRIAKKMVRTKFQKPIEPNTTNVFEHFDSDEKLKRWKVQADSDTKNGFSTATLTRSRHGHALFQGHLDTTCPDDGLTQVTGFAAMMGPQRERDHIVTTGEYWDWGRYNCFEIRYRGDGRKYHFVINTSNDNSDIAFYDNHFYPLYTRGGPHWQTTRIPFPKFIFDYKGLIQDNQRQLPTFMVKFVALSINDRINGPFSIEVDYMGLRQELRPFTDVQPYEDYYIPHLRYRPITLDCDAPEN